MIPNMWQIISRDTSNIIEVLKDNERFLSTVDLAVYIGDNKFETALYEDGEFTILGRYPTKDEAIAEHQRLSKKYNFTDEF